MSKLRKKRLLAAFATFLALMILTKSFSLDVLANGSKEQLFNDVTTDHWAYKQITSIGNKGIIKGYGDGTFRPGDKVTRAHAAVMIVNALKLDYVGKVPNFSDVPSEHWAAEHIAVAQETGIIKGYKDGTFKPGENITRGQISVMVVNAFNLEQKDSYKDFSDVPSTHFFQ